MTDSPTTRRQPLPLILLSLGLAPLLVVLGVWLISRSHQHYDTQCMVSGQMESGWSLNHAQAACETAWQAQLVGGAALVIVGLVVLSLSVGRR